MFQRQFGQLEHALGNLLHAIVDAGKSQIPFAIYYSPTGFDARVRVVDNALLEAISENPRLRLLRKDTRWPFIKGKIGKIRELRNDIAHGSLENLIIGNKPYVRWMPPRSDVIRMSRRIVRRQIPGIGAGEILRRRSLVWPVIECIDDVTSVVKTSRGRNPLLPHRYRELEGHLRALRDLNPTAQK